MSTLAGKTALVTGASRGIGRATALALAKNGAQVLIHYSSSAPEAEAVVTEITAGGGRARAIAADLAKPSEISDADARRCGKHCRGRPERSFALHDMRL